MDCVLAEAGLGASFAENALERTRVAVMSTGIPMWTDPGRPLVATVCAFSRVSVMLFVERRVVHFVIGSINA